MRRPPPGTPTSQSDAAINAAHAAAKVADYCIGKERDQRRQRGNLGFSDEDMWSLDYYLAGLLGNAIATFIETDTFTVWTDEQREELSRAAELFKDYARECPATEEAYEAMPEAFALLQKHWGRLWF